MMRAWLSFVCLGQSSSIRHARFMPSATPVDYFAENWFPAKIHFPASVCARIIEFRMS